MKYLLGSICFALAACQPSLPEIIQLSSKTSPAGGIAATWSETSGGATTDFVYRLHVHRENSSSPLLVIDNEVLRTNNIIDTEVSWASDNTLVLKCLRGDVYFWINRSVLGDRNIRIEMNSTCPTTKEDQWVYIAPGTPVEDIPSVVRAEARIQNLLNNDQQIVRGNVSARVLYNSNMTKEIIVASVP